MATMRSRRNTRAARRAGGDLGTTQVRGSPLRGRRGLVSSLRPRLDLLAPEPRHPLRPRSIRKKWAERGWEHGLGYPTCDAAACGDGVGRYNHFRKADGVDVSVFWTPATAARTVYGSIRKKWAECGWERGLGYPTTDEATCGDGVGRYNHFRKADGVDVSVFWTRETGAHVVYGSIRDKWAEYGWETGLGYPTSDESDGPATADQPLPVRHDLLASRNRRRRAGHHVEAGRERRPEPASRRRARRFPRLVKVRGRISLGRDSAQEVPGQRRSRLRARRSSTGGNPLELGTDRRHRRRDRCRTRAGCVGIAWRGGHRRGEGSPPQQE